MAGLELQFEYEAMSYDVSVVHDDGDSTATCDLCGTSVEDSRYCCTDGSPPLFHLHVDCIDQRMNFLQRAYENGRELDNSNQQEEFISFLQTLFNEITKKMCSQTWTEAEAMPEDFVFPDRDGGYKANLGVLDGPADEDDAFRCMVCGESLQNEQVYTSDVTSDFRIHAKCALEVCVYMCSRSPSTPPSPQMDTEEAIESPKMQDDAIETPASRPFDPPPPSPPRSGDGSNPSLSPFSKFLASFYAKISRKNQSTATPDE